MKKETLIQAVLGLAAFVFFITLMSGNTYGASGGDIEKFVINSTGTTVITFDRNKTETFWIKYSTGEAYINYTSTTCDGTQANDIFIREGSVIWDRVEVNNWRLSIYVSSAPVDIQGYGKGH